MPLIYATRSMLDLIAPFQAIKKGGLSDKFFYYFEI